MRRTFFIVLFVTVLLSLTTTVALAQSGAGKGGGGFVPLVDVSGSSRLGQLYADSNPGDLTNFINTLFKFMLSVGAIAAVLRIAYAGYLYMGQADMWSHKGEAKAIIGDVTLGLLLLLGIYLILYEINPDIVKLSALKTIQQNPVQQAPANTGQTQPANGAAAPSVGNTPFSDPLSGYTPSQYSGSSYEYVPGGSSPGLNTEGYSSGMPQP